jgi:CheY-like chemotaxis protein
MILQTEGTNDDQRRFVLVADDEEAVLHIVAHVIAGLGLVPLKAQNGAIAVELAGKYQSALACAILDIQMPILNGADAAYTIQQMAPDLPIVMMTGGFTDDLLNRISQVRKFKLLAKPFSLAKLRELILQIVGITTLPTPS